MLTVDLDFLLGMAIGIIILNKESCEEEKLDWAFMLMLGPIAISITKQQ